MAKPRPRVPSTSLDPELNGIVIAPTANTFSTDYVRRVSKLDRHAPLMSPAAWQDRRFSVFLIRLFTAAAICVFGTSANALTMDECKAKYKAENAAGTRTATWAVYQVKRCGIDPKANDPKADATTPKPAAATKQ